MEDIYVGDCTFLWMNNDVWNSYILFPLFQCSEVALATCLGIFSLVRFFNQIFLKRFLTKYFWKQISPKIWLPNLADDCFPQRFDYQIFLNIYFPRDILTKSFWEWISSRFSIKSFWERIPPKIFNRIYLKIDFHKSEEDFPMFPQSRGLLNFPPQTGIYLYHLEDNKTGYSINKAYKDHYTVYRWEWKKWITKKKWPLSIRTFFQARRPPYRSHQGGVGGRRSTTNDINQGMIAHNLVKNLNSLPGQRK